MAPGQAATRGDEPWQAKGVDRLLQRDILALAENKAVTDLIIVTGDQDMEEELDVAGQHGLLIHLWGIADQAQQDQISGRLLRIVDDWQVLPPDWAAVFVPDDNAQAPDVPLTSDDEVDAFRSSLRGGESHTDQLDADGEPVKWGVDQLRSVGRAA